MVGLSISERKYLALYYLMWQLLPLKSLCEDVLAHMDKLFEGWNINSTDFEDNMGCIYNAKSKNIYPGTKHIDTHVNLFRDNICDKDTNPHGNTILIKCITRFIQKIH